MTHLSNYSIACSIVLFFGALLLHSLESSAQLMVGPRLGGQISWVNFDDKDLKEAYDQKMLPGYSAGFTVAFEVERRFYLQADLVYSRKGKRIEGKLDELLEYKSINHFISLPLIYRMDFKASAGGNLAYKWFMGLGPNISYWWKGNGTLQSSDVSETRLTEYEYKVKFNSSPDEHEGEDVLIVNNPNRLQLGINFSTGLVFEPTGGNIFVVDLRFELGHTFQAKEEYGTFIGVADFADPLRSRNMGLRLGVSYLFDTKISQRKKGKSTGKG